MSKKADQKPGTATLFNTKPPASKAAPLQRLEESQNIRVDDWEIEWNDQGAEKSHFSVYKKKQSSDGNAAFRTKKRPRFENEPPHSNGFTAAPVKQQENDEYLKYYEEEEIEEMRKRRSNSRLDQATQPFSSSVQSIQRPEFANTTNPFASLELGGTDCSAIMNLAPLQTTDLSIVTPDAVNPAGSHVHNRLNFLLNPKDAQRRGKDHPMHSNMTLGIDYMELTRVGGALSPISHQWWCFKGHFADSIIFFKIGHIIHLYHMDADVGVKVLELVYIKGNVAKTTFAENKCDIMAEKLLQAGYNVALVEQTETSEALNECKTRGSLSADAVINREVCVVLTPGTHARCYINDEDLFDEQQARNNGPLLVIREVVLEDASSIDSNNDEEEQPVWEYGITLVDADLATVTIGQFADDVLRSRMNTLLTSFSPSEVRM